MVVKKLVKHSSAEKCYAWNASTCVFEPDKYCGFGDFLNDCEFTKRIFDNLIVTYDKIEHTPESIVINPSNEINYQLITVAPLPAPWLLFHAAIIGKYFMKIELKFFMSITILI